jgi:hypothetical protein
MNVRKGDKFYSDYFKAVGTVVSFENKDNWYFRLDNSIITIKADTRPENLKWTYLQSKNISNESSDNMTEKKSINDYINQFKTIFRRTLKEEPQLPAPVPIETVFGAEMIISSQNIKLEDNIVLQFKSIEGKINIKITRMGENGIADADVNLPFPETFYDGKDITIDYKLTVTQ